MKKDDPLEKMMEQLIQLVGHNNAVTEELSQRMDNLENKVNGGFQQLTSMITLSNEKAESEINALKINTASKEFAKRTEKMITLLMPKQQPKKTWPKFALI
ncbi:Hypothetical protein LUCI_3156 [Lucifera butyrica]|uniref:Uncharacterized protein n=1 Tax=Lucifera butyrica TaxID=1351585 RepID=A0A498R932_9FIRM|nr:hypothetical protein [Lucifera butyrica]VBB07891.1 Hypothetical protein LUCI_3156 [Lucifera butyrica]